MPEFEITPSLKWAAHRTWNATKVLLKNITNVNRSDFLEPDAAKSIFDFKEEQANIKHLLINENFYDQANALKKEIKYATDIPRSLSCLDSIDRYIGTRNASIKESSVPIQKIQARFHALKADIQDDEIRGKNIGLFSLVNELFLVKREAMGVLQKQLEEDIKTLSSSPDKDNSKAIEELKEALKKFEETISTEIKIELNKARIENSRLALVKLLREKGSAETKRLLDNNAILDDAHAVTVGAKGKRPDLGGALGKIRQFETLSGQSVQQSKPGTFELKIPGRYDFMYHNGLQDNLAADLQLLALAVKASGSKEITMELKGSNTDDIHLIAKKAYEACIKAGFKGGKDGEIHFKVNGRVMKLFDELDKDNKTVKGVFSDEHEMALHEDKALHNRMKTLEQRDPRWSGRDPQPVGDSVELSEATDTAITGGLNTARTHDARERVQQEIVPQEGAPLRIDGGVQRRNSI